MTLEEEEEEEGSAAEVAYGPGKPLQIGPRPPAVGEGVPGGLGAAGQKSWAWALGVEGVAGGTKGAVASWPGGVVRAGVEGE